jgi:hypothetical protein
VSPPELTKRCKQLMFGGDARESRLAGERAVVAAGKSGDVALEVDALAALGYTLAFSGAAARAVELLTRAVALAEAAPVAVRAEAVAIFGTVLEASGDAAGAERETLRGLALRREAYGEDSRLVAVSYGELARLHSVQGKPEAEGRVHLARAIALLTRYLDDHTAHDDDWAEAIQDRARLEVNLAQSFASDQAAADSLTALETAAATFAAARGSRDNVAVLDNAGELAERLAAYGESRADDASLPADFVARANAVAERLTLRFPATPAERDARLFFRSLRRYVALLRGRGVPDSSIAQVLTQAMRGVDQLEESIRDIPELIAFAEEFSARAAASADFAGAIAFGLLGPALDAMLDSLEQVSLAIARAAAAP